MTDYLPDETPVTRDLASRGIPFQFFHHPGQVQSLEQAAAERGQRPDQIVRSIVFRLVKDEYIMVLVSGPEQISWPKLRKHLGTTRMSMASPDEILKLTGYPTGAVSPFGFQPPIRLLVDGSVFREEILSIGAGVRNTTVILRRDDLLRALGAVEVGNFLDEKSHEAL